MANVVVTIRIMPDSPDADLKVLEQKATEIINKYCKDDKAVGKINVIPVAFGLKAIDLLFVMDEKMGDTEPLEKELSKLEGINSVETTDVRRAVG